MVRTGTAPSYTHMPNQRSGKTPILFIVRFFVVVVVGGLFLFLRQGLSVGLVPVLEEDSHS